MSLFFIIRKCAALMITRFRPTRERNSLQGEKETNQEPLTNRKSSIQCWKLPIKDDISLRHFLRSLNILSKWGSNLQAFIQRPVSIVDDNSLLGSARDGIVVLEQPYVASGVSQEGVIRNGVTPFHACAPNVSHRQTVENFCPSTRKKQNQTNI